MTVSTHSGMRDFRLTSDCQIILSSATQKDSSYIQEGSSFGRTSRTYGSVVVLASWGRSSHFPTILSWSDRLAPFTREGFSGVILLAMSNCVSMPLSSCTVSVNDSMEASALASLCFCRIISSRLISASSRFSLSIENTSSEKPAGRLDTPPPAVEPPALLPPRMAELNSVSLPIFASPSSLNKSNKPIFPFGTSSAAAALPLRASSS
mmetsp:Transcript_95972/g.273618  ORF Transcript_95972/g.273618 Transcript_95972/m.273618 type:complete len:208 (-) Transcript_95972:2060-2683(-)